MLTLLTKIKYYGELLDWLKISIFIRMFNINYIFMKKFFLALVALLSVCGAYAQGVFAVKAITNVGEPSIVVGDNGKFYGVTAYEYSLVKQNPSAYVRVIWTGEKPFRTVAEKTKASIDTLSVDSVYLAGEKPVLVLEGKTVALSEPDWLKLKKGDKVIRYALDGPTRRFVRYETPEHAKKAWEDNDVDLDNLGLVAETKPAPTPEPTPTVTPKPTATPEPTPTTPPAIRPTGVIKVTI